MHKNHPRLLLFSLSTLLITKSFAFLPQAVTFLLLGWLHWLPICSFHQGSPTPIKLLPKRSFSSTESHTCFKHFNVSFKIKLNSTSRFTVRNPLTSSQPHFLPFFPVYSPFTQCACNPQAHDGVSHLLAWMHVLSYENTFFTPMPQKEMQSCNSNSLNINHCSHQISLVTLKRISYPSLTSLLHSSFLLFFYL